MPSFRTSRAVAATVLLALNAQAQTTYNIDPNTVPEATRDFWCTQQKTSCPLICLQLPGVTSTTTESNTCDPATLAFSCVCVNGISPNASQFSQTVPFFECQQFGNNCVTACNGDSACQAACRADNPCGAQDPVLVNTTTSSAMPSTTGNGGATSTGAGQVFSGLAGATTAASASGNKSGASKATLEMGQTYGLVVVFAGVFAGFALIM